MTDQPQGPKPRAKCAECGSYNLRWVAQIVMSGPLMKRNVTKKAIRSKDVEIIMANWPQMDVICYDCGYIVVDRGVKKRIENY